MWRMKKYDEYKDSGVEWIGKVPSHWEVCRLKHIASINGRVGYKGYTTADLVTEGNGAYAIGGKHITNCYLNLSNADYISWEKYYESPEIMVQKGDLVMAQRGSLGKVAFIDREIGAATINPSLVLLNKLKVVGKFLYYSLLSDNILTTIGFLNTSTAVPMISQNQIENMVIPIPPFGEQNSIASYLDKKCGEIDKVIFAQQKRIALLQELKQSVITHAVTKGLNPNVEMKDSGVEWIGEVPKYWEVCRFKDFISLKTDASISEVKIGLENIESKSGKFIETSTEFEGNGVAFAKADVVYGKLRPYLQKVWLAEFDGNAVGDFFVFRAKRNSTPSFIKYLLLSDGFTKEADGSTVGAKMPRVSSNFILTMHYCLPTKSEQHAIATYLDKKCASIDSSISKAQHQVALLQEYKQSLITEVVTGKRKVC